MSVLPTISPDDLFGLRFLQAARFSSDGKTVAFAVSQVAQPEAGEEPEEHTSIWLLSLETGQARQLTAGLARDTHPHFSPDGQHIAFLSSRGPKPQIYVIAVNGGEARAVTSLKQGVGSGPVWSPDGKLIAFTAGPAQDPPKPNSPFRLRRTIYRFDGMGYLDGAVQDIYMARIEGGEAKQLTSNGWHYSLPQWSPDGQEILCIASMSPDSLNAYHGRIRAIGLEGVVQEITGDWGRVASAAWTQGGQQIVFCGAPRGRAIGSKNDLWVVGRNGNEPQCRTTGLAVGVGGGLQPDMPALWDEVSTPRILLSPDGQEAYVRIQEGGTLPTYRVALNGRESWTQVLSGERSTFIQDLSPQHLLYVVSTLDNPADLFIANLDGSGERQLTQLNSALLQERALPSSQHLLFSSSDDTQVEGWLLKPPRGQAPYPTILYIHGGPHSGFGHIFSFDFQMLCGAGYAVLLVNQRGSTGYGDAFATQIKGDWGNLDYQDLMAGVDFAIARGLADPQRLGCCGLSGGGNLSCWIVGQTNRFKAAVPENPVTNWVSFYGVSDIGPWFAVEELGGKPYEIPEVYQRCSPISYAHQCTTPTLLIQGEADYRCPAEQSEQFYTVLKANGCTVEMLRLPASSHGGSIEGPPILRQAQNQALLEWMNRYVLGMGSA